ncbi:hypothetical protein [Halpernia sp. GG3]
MFETEISGIIIDAGLKVHKKLGLLLNFNSTLFKDEIKRIVNDL